MLRISKLTDYGTVVMATLAEAKDEKLSASKLAEITRLEVPTVAKVLKLLAAAELVESFRGVQGGYRLARPPERISVADMVSAVEGPIALTECSIEAGLCSYESRCCLRGNWRRIGQVVESALEQLSLADMLPSDTRSIPLNVGDIGWGERPANPNTQR